MAATQSENTVAVCFCGYCGHTDRQHDDFDGICSKCREADPDSREYAHIFTVRVRETTSIEEFFDGGWRYWVNELTPRVPTALPENMLKTDRRRHGKHSIESARSCLHAAAAAVGTKLKTRTKGGRLWVLRLDGGEDSRN